MSRPQDEDEHWRHNNRIFIAAHRHDPPLSEEDRIRRFAQHDWVAIFSEAVTESDPLWFQTCHAAWDNDDSLLLGELIYDRITEYARECAAARGLLDD